MSKLFLSHEWGCKDKVRSIARELRRRGFNIWIDIDKMHGNISVCMADGVRQSTVVLLFLSSQYIKKVNSGYVWDNCYREFAYSLFLRKRIIPIVMEPTLLNVEMWPHGILTMSIHNVLYIDGCTDDISSIVDCICRRLIREHASMRPLPRVREKKTVDTVLFI